MSSSPSNLSSLSSSRLADSRQQNRSLMADFDPWWDPTTVVPPVPAADGTMPNPVMFFDKVIIDTLQ